MLSIQVRGTPAPKGSNRAMVRGGRAVFVPGGSKVNQVAIHSWDVNVRAAASIAVGIRTAPVFVDRPVAVEIEFRLARPSGHWGKHGLKPGAPMAPMRKPDLDKLARCTLDSLSGIVFDDDARIVELTTSKVYADPGNEGATIRVGGVA